MAGTTVHDPDYVNDALRQALAAAGVARTHREINAFMGVQKPIAIRALVEFHEPASDVGAIHADFVRRMLELYRTGDDVREIEGIGDLLRDLRLAGTKVALDTGFSRDIADAILDRLGWSVPETLDASVTSDEASGRPAPDMIFEAMRRTHVADPKRVAKVGDTPSDIGQGLAAGCGLTLAVTYGTHSAAELGRHDGVSFAATVDELRGLLL